MVALGQRPMANKGWQWLWLGAASGMAVIVVPQSLAHAGEACVARSVDKVGQCHKRRFARRVVDDQLRGIETATPVQPAGIDPDMVATQLIGRFAKGKWYPVKGSRNDWMLVVSTAYVGIAPGYALQSNDDAAQAMIALVKVTPRRAIAPDEKPIVAVVARSDGLMIGTGAEIGDVRPGQDFVPCADPDPEEGGGGGYSDVAGQFRWMVLSAKHHVLAATVSRSEGYAGGGGSFSGEILLEIRGARMVPVACYAVSRYQMFGGEWNPDGTRQHPESQASWDIRTTGKQDWPTLRLQAMTQSTRSATLIWDAKSGHYRER